MKDELAESSRKQQKLNEENNKLKDQLTSYQDKLKYVLIIKKKLLILTSTDLKGSVNRKQQV